MLKNCFVSWFGPHQMCAQCLQSRRSWVLQVAKFTIGDFRSSNINIHSCAVHCILWFKNMECYPYKNLDGAGLFLAGLCRASSWPFTDDVHKKLKLWVSVFKKSQIVIITRERQTRCPEFLNPACKDGLVVCMHNDALVHSNLVFESWPLCQLYLNFKEI